MDKTEANRDGGETEGTGAGEGSASSARPSPRDRAAALRRRLRGIGPRLRSAALIVALGGAVHMFVTREFLPGLVIAAAGILVMRFLPSEEEAD